MKEIKRVSLVGLGALGILFGKTIADSLPRGDFRVVADAGRIDRYRRDGVYYNDALCDFAYALSGEAPETPDDLILFGVKFGGLEAAIDAVRGRVGPDTLILSMLNGVSSEEIIGRAFGPEKVIPCVAQGMSAVREGSRLICKDLGQLAIGEVEPGIVTDRIRRVDAFLTRAGVPHTVYTNMMHHMWGKLMTNVGCNQTIAVYRGTYGTTQAPGEARDTQIAAMREVMAVAAPEGITLTEEDLTYWLGILDSLDPKGKPSMAQDVEAGRKTEVALFAGTVLRLGERHGVETPVNRRLYDALLAMEAGFSQGS